MAVRLTESRIPDDFKLEDAKKLGHAVVQGNYALISYLGPTLRMGEQGDYKKYIKNTYVVFVNTAGNVPDPTSYAWSLKFFEKGKSISFHELSVEKTPDEEGMMFQLDTEDSDLDTVLNGKTLSRLVVSVQIDGSGAALTLEHPIEDLKKGVEAFIASINKEDNQSASVGDPDLTRLLANDYGDLLFDLDAQKAKGESIDIFVLS